MYCIQDVCTAYKAGVLYSGQLHFKQVNTEQVLYYIQDRRKDQI